MNKLILFSFIILALFLAGCENVDVSKMSDADLQRVADKAIVCNAPYIRFATGCCLDQNTNGICDSDETSAAIQTSPTPQTSPNVTPPVADVVPEKSSTVLTKEQVLSDCGIFNSFYEDCNDLSLNENCLKKYGEDPIEAGQVPENDKCYVLVLCSDLAGSREYNLKRSECSGIIPPDKCTMPSGVDCLDFSRTEAGAVVILQNYGGFNMQSVQVKLSDVDGTVLSSCIGASSLADGEKSTYTCAVLGMTVPFKAVLSISYTNAQTDMMHTKNGELWFFNRK